MRFGAVGETTLRNSEIKFNLQKSQKM